MGIIKARIIHALGGITADEAAQNETYIHNEGIRLGRNKGRRETVAGMRQYAEYLYKRPTDEWSRMMYEHILEVEAQLE